MDIFDIDSPNVYPFNFLWLDTCIDHASASSVWAQWFNILQLFCNDPRHTFSASRRKPTVSLFSVLAPAGDGERWERASVAAVHEGSGQQGERGRRVPADGLAPSILGELPAHTALYPAHGRPPATALPPLHRHHGQLASCSCLYIPRNSLFDWPCSLANNCFGNCCSSGITLVSCKMKEWQALTSEWILFPNLSAQLAPPVTFRLRHNITATTWCTCTQPSFWGWAGTPCGCRVWRRRPLVSVSLTTSTKCWPTNPGSLPAHTSRYSKAG